MRDEKWREKEEEEEKRNETGNKRRNGESEKLDER